MRLVRLISLFLAPLLLAASAARAQSVRWEPAENGMLNAVVLVFENCLPDGPPALPTIPGVTFTMLGQSESMNIVNFQATRSLSISYLVRGKQNAPVQIPAFMVKTDKGMLKVAPFNAAAPAPPLESVATSRLVPERTTVWAGEVFGLNYELSATRRTNPQISPTFDWNPSPLIAEDWSKYEITDPVVNGERRVNVLFRTRVIAKTPNTVKLEAANHLLTIQTGSVGSIFGPQPRMEQVSVTSDQPTIDVKALPPSPAGFHGAVGNFKLVPKVVPEKASVGEPVTWTLELSGTGNWPEIAGLPSREVSNDFQVVQPKAKRTPAEGKLFDVTLSEDVVLLPSKPGTYTLGPVTFSYFDPKSGSYKTATAERKTVTVTAPAAPQINIAGAANNANESDATKPEPTAPAAHNAITPPPPPGGIPRDPLPGSAATIVPMAKGTLIALLIAPFAALLGFWAWLALRRAKQTDPVRPRREARDRLARTLSDLQSAHAQDRTTLIRAWQRDTATLWQLRHAAPPAAALPDNRWTALWAEADRALYGAKVPLPSDWIARAQEALAAKRVPGFQPWRLFLPQNLMPFAAVVAIGFVTTTVWLRAAEADGAVAYRQGNFAAAEKAWRERIASAPTDWIARHNLSLALAQQERASEAAAQAAAAFVQHPGDAAVRWHFGFAADKLGAAPAALAHFLTPGPLQVVARLASPAVWQRVLVAAVWLIAIAIGWLLFGAYGQRTAQSLWTAITLLVVSGMIACSASASALSYGLAAKSEAVVVARSGTLRSIPTEADTTQKTSPLAAGSIALAAFDKTYLGWIRIAFENGQTGWVRKEEIVPLWK